MVCHCAASAPCHADVLIGELARQDGDLTHRSRLLLGVPFSPADFAVAAAGCRHPFSGHSVSDSLAEALSAKFAAPATATVKLRLDALTFWRGRAAALQPAEADLKRRMDPEVRTVMRTKSILLFGEMLEAISSPAREQLTHCMAAGFPMSDLYPLTRIFPQRTREQVLTVQNLWRTA